MIKAIVRRDGSVDYSFETDADFEAFMRVRREAARPRTIDRKRYPREKQSE